MISISKFNHWLSPLPVYCRLRSFLPKEVAKTVGKSYEVHIYRPIDRAVNFIRNHQQYHDEKGGDKE